MAHGTLINGVQRNITGGFTLVNGVERKITKGLTLVNGVQRKIAFGPDDCTITMYGTRTTSSQENFKAFVYIDGQEYTMNSVAPSTQVVVPNGTQIELEVLTNNGNRLAYIKINGTTVRTGDAEMMFTVTKDTDITMSYTYGGYDYEDLGGIIEVTELE